MKEQKMVFWFLMSGKLLESKCTFSANCSSSWATETQAIFVDPFSSEPATENRVQVVFVVLLLPVAFPTVCSDHAWQSRCNNFTWYPPWLLGRHGISCTEGKNHGCTPHICCHLCSMTEWWEGFPPDSPWTQSLFFRSTLQSTLGYVNALPNLSRTRYTKLFWLFLLPFTGAMSSVFLKQAADTGMRKAG